MWGDWPDKAEDLSVDQWELLFEESTSKRRSPILTGTAKWGGGGGKSNLEQEGQTFKATADLSALVKNLRDDGGEGEESFAYVVAIAKVDQAWADRSRWDTSPHVPPQVKENRKEHETCTVFCENTRWYEETGTDHDPRAYKKTMRVLVLGKRTFGARMLMICGVFCGWHFLSHAMYMG